MHWVSKYIGICIYNHKPQGCVLPSSCVYQIPGLKELQLLWRTNYCRFFPKNIPKVPSIFYFGECVASASGTVPSMTDTETSPFCMILCTHGTKLKAK